MPAPVREIQNDEWVVRGIPADGINSQTGEPTSFYFKTAELSTFLLSVSSIRFLLELGDFVQLAALNAGYCREIGLTVTHTPIKDDPALADNDEHVSIFMPKPGRAGRADRLKRHAVTVPVAGRAPEELLKDLQHAISAIGSSSSS